MPQQLPLENVIAKRKGRITSAGYLLDSPQSNRILVDIDHFIVERPFQDYMFERTGIREVV